MSNEKKMWTGWDPGSEPAEAAFAGANWLGDFLGDDEHQIAALLEDMKRQGKTCELTGTAAFGLAVAAGVPVTTRMDGNRLVMTLAHPVSVWCERGEIRVYTRDGSPNAPVRHERSELSGPTG